MIDERKLEHIEVCLEEEVEARRRTGFSDVRVVHDALPGLDLSDVDTSAEFLGHELDAPIVIPGMTGGHQEAKEINRVLAQAASEAGVALGVGSQRAALENPELADTYSVVADEAPDTLKLANVGGPQLVEGYGVEEAREAVEMVEAGALAVHLNFTQEAVQPEGDTDGRGLQEALEEVQEGLDVPVIVKETGAGISLNVARRLEASGIPAVDVSGVGGTSWSAVEIYRAESQGDEESAEVGETFREWGVPTVQAVVECGSTGLDVMASGGVRSGVHVAQSLALGADVAGGALPLLKAANKGVDETEALLQRWVEELRTAMFLTGSGDLDALKNASLTITGKTAEILEARGFPPREFARRDL